MSQTMYISFDDNEEELYNLYNQIGKKNRTRLIKALMKSFSDQYHSLFLPDNSQGLIFLAEHSDVIKGIENTQTPVPSISQPIQKSPAADIPKQESTPEPKTEIQPEKDTDQGTGLYDLFSSITHDNN